MSKDMVSSSQYLSLLGSYSELREHRSECSQKVWSWNCVHFSPVRAETDISWALTFWAEIQTLPSRFYSFLLISEGLPDGASGEEPTCQCRRHNRVRSLGQEDLLEEGMATHPSILAWRIPGTEEPGGLSSMGSHRAGHD